MLLSVEGTFRHGRVELAEQPKGVEEARVIVTFLAPANGQQQALKPANGETEEQKREVMRQRAFARMQKGYHLGGGPYYKSREELYEERLRRYDKSDAGQ